MDAQLSSRPSVSLTNDALLANAGHGLGHAFLDQNFEVRHVIDTNVTVTVVSGWKNEPQSAIANVTPAGVLAEQHRRMAQPESASERTDSAAPRRDPPG